jgi:HPt (histidine-containing phosphotransfer) domain-containing protein
MKIESERLLIGFFQASKVALNSTTRESGFNDALKILAEATDVDRVYICKHMTDMDTDEMYFSLIHEWASDQVEHQIKSPNFRKISYSRFSLLEFYENLSKGRTLKFVLKDLPVDYRLGFLDTRIKSIILIPIMVDDNYWGFLGFDEVNTDKEWTKADEKILIKFTSKLALLIKEGSREKQSRIQKANPKLHLIDEENLFSVFIDETKPELKFFADILNVYSRDIPLMGKEIEIAIEQKDFNALKYLTHKLGGSLLNLGAESVVGICHQIEKAAKENIIDDNVMSLNTQLQENIKRLVAEIISLREKYLIEIKDE